MFLVYCSDRYFWNRIIFTLYMESPFVRPAEDAKLGTEYERVQREMDVKLGAWEKMQG